MRLLRRFSGSVVARGRSGDVEGDGRDGDLVTLEVVGELDGLAQLKMCIPYVINSTCHVCFL